LDRRQSGKKTATALQHTAKEAKVDLALFVLRAIVGLLFIGHGAQKLFGAFRGGGLDATASNFEQVGLRPGRLHATAAGLAETGGGSLLALGLLTPLGAIAVIAVMTAAVMTIHLPNGVWVSENGFEYNLVLGAVAFALVAIGPGSWSLDDVFGIDLAGVGWAFAALAAGLLGGMGAVLSGRLSQSHHHGGTGPHAHPV
jgi:putative oxidoreductase